MQTNVTLKTSGNGFWSDKIANVYVTKFELTCFHYHYGEDEDEWNYVKMTEDYDVITEKTFSLFN